jgi:hypothetical protein
VACKKGETYLVAVPVFGATMENLVAAKTRPGLGKSTSKLNKQRSMHAPALSTPNEKDS